MKNLDVDSMLDEVKHARASMDVMLRSIDGLFGDDYGYYEATALIYQTESVIELEKKRFDRIIADLRKSGAKDYDLSDNFSETAEVTQ